MVPFRFRVTRFVDMVSNPSHAAGSAVVGFGPGGVLDNSFAAHHHQQQQQQQHSGRAAPVHNPSSAAERRTHVRSRSDATGLLSTPDLRSYAGPTGLLLSSSSGSQLRPRLTLGDLTSGRAFDNGCGCFESCQAAVNDLRGRKTHCESPLFRNAQLLVLFASPNIASVDSVMLK